MSFNAMTRTVQLACIGAQAKLLRTSLANAEWRRALVAFQDKSSAAWELYCARRLLQLSKTRSSAWRSKLQVLMRESLQHEQPKPQPNAGARLRMQHNCQQQLTPARSTLRTPSGLRREIKCSPRRYCSGTSCKFRPRRAHRPPPSCKRSGKPHDTMHAPTLARPRRRPRGSQRTLLKHEPRTVMLSPRSPEERHSNAQRTAPELRTNAVHQGSENSYNSDRRT